MDVAFTVTTDKDVATAIRDLEAALVERRFSALWHLDVRAKLAEKGVELGPQFHILEVCSAPRAKEALEANIQVGYFLPCKIVVYRDASGTKIGLLRPKLLIGLLGDPRLADLARAVEAELTAAVAAAR